MSLLELSHLGRYRILEELGRGAMGVVHRAEDPSLGRIVAIKAVKLSADAADSMDYQARFYQEAKAAGSLSHPGIITIYDTGHEQNWAYIAMELLEGVELRDLMARGRMPLHHALDIAAQVADALEFAHQRGVVHRDIKPGNIMVLHGNHAKIMDFGIARMRVSSVETQVGLVLGSPKYMSPEQVAGRRVDHRSDIFSLGVVLFEILAGIAPFSGRDVGDLMYAVVNTHPPRPSQLNPSVPDMLDLIVAKALHKDLAARYQSASEFAADLRLCRDALGEEIAPPPGVGESTLPNSIEVTAPLPAGAGDDVASEPAPVAPASDPASETRPAADATTVPLPSPAIASPPPGQLWFSRRFPSAAALARLTRPSPEDVRRLSRAPLPATLLARWLATPGDWLRAIVILGALAAAIVIALG